MTVLQAEVYDALRAANVPEDTARRGAEAMGEIVTDVRLLKWMVATDVALTIGLLGAMAGLYVLLFNLAARLPR